jgi:hypothetical protein
MLCEAIAMYRSARPCVRNEDDIRMRMTATSSFDLCMRAQKLIRMQLACITTIIFACMLYHVDRERMNAFDELRGKPAGKPW